MKKRKIPRPVKILIVIVVLLIAMTGGVYGFLQYTIGKIQTVDKSEESKIDASKENFEKDSNIAEGSNVIDPSQITWDGADPEVMKDKDIANILLIGQDRREGQDRQRSDSMILITINKRNGKLSMTSFMRDLYVQIPGYSDNRLNAAYAFGGMSLLDETLEKNFGIHVDGNVEVDFDSFKSCIDTLGGVELFLNQNEVDYMEDPSLKEGQNLLNGEQVLAYTRIRYVGDGDYERTARQRRVLVAAFNKFKDSDIGTIMNTINSLLPYLSTDLSTNQILGYALEVLKTGTKSVDNYRIPIDDGYESAVIQEMMVLVPDLKKNQDYLKEKLYGEN